MKRMPRLRSCPVCGGALAPADLKIRHVLVNRKVTRKRWGCKSCGVVVVLHRWRRK
jgi:hypothetical protein